MIRLLPTLKAFEVEEIIIVIKERNMGKPWPNAKLQKRALVSAVERPRDSIS